MAEKTSATVKTSEPGPREGRREAPPPAILGLAGSLLDLQSAVGNRGVGRLLGGALLQPKLRIGPARDAYEREADRMAEAVVGNGPAAPISEVGGDVQRMCAECEEDLVQRMCADCQKEEEEGLVQRMCAECQEEEEEELLQPKADGAPPSTAGPAFESRLGSLRGSGRPLPADLRGFFEPRFGHDFGAVRVHTGSAAGEAAQAVSARAFTVGNDVVFGAGEWSPGTTAGKRLLAHELTHVVQQTPRMARRKPVLQRAPEETGEAAPAAEESVPETEPSPETSPETSPGEPGTEPVAAEPTTATAIVVDDSAEEVGEGQMKKSDFMARLRTEVCAATEAGLAGTSHSAQGCPLIEFWFGYYEGTSVERINRDLPRFVDAEPRPVTAADYITVITERVRRSVSTWASTGEITGVPRDLPLPGMNLPGVGAAAGQAAGGVSFKALPGGPRNPGSPQALRARLGVGRPLDGGLRSRMESAFGRSFGHVRMHTDGHAAGLSRSLNARAFTVGEHVAFGPRQYRPGTIAGDALIAHELAHVAQQGGAAAAVQPLSVGGASYGALERDADMAAVGAVASLWGVRLPGLRRPLQTAPRLRSGLRLQRCGDCNGKEEAAAPATTPSTTPPPNERLTRSVTVKPTDKGCGGSEMAAIFSVENATASTNGFVVQKLTFDLKREKCAGGDASFQKTYWEAWEVRKGIVYIGTLKARHDSDGRGDHFWVSSTPKHKGNNFEQGKAKYMPGYKEPYSWGNIQEAGALPATYSEPKGWSDSGTIDRWFRNEFDCCDGKTKPKFTHQE